MTLGKLVAYKVAEAQREKIISLARECHIKSLTVKSNKPCEFYELTDSAIVALYKAAQAEAYEKAAVVCEKRELVGYAEWTPVFCCGEALAGSIRKLKEQS